jgi:hypothetical protein
MLRKVARAIRTAIGGPAVVLTVATGWRRKPRPVATITTFGGVRTVNAGGQALTLN